MSDRCELCGAKLRSVDEACRECGAPASGDAEASDVTADVTAVESVMQPREWGAPGEISSAHIDDTDPGLPLDPAPRRRGPWLLAVGLVAVAGIGVTAYARMGTEAETEALANPAESEASAAQAARAPDDAAQPSAVAGCSDLEALAGRWVFTTEVTGSRVVQSSGLNGFYELDVEIDGRDGRDGLDGCAATASLTKTGYTARKYAEGRVQRARAPLTAGSGEPEGTAVGTFDLESAAGTHGIIEFTFTARGDELFGVYRQRGARWRETGLSGFLRGSRSDDVPRDLAVASHPCSTRCALACGTDAREVAPEALRSCVQACTEDDDAPARCGDVAPIPSDFTLALTGPGKLAKLCKRIGGCAKRIGRGRSDQSLDDRLPDGWTEAKYVRGEKEGGVRLALHGVAGWWLSAPLFEVPRGSRLGKLRLHARQLGEGEARRYVLGLARTEEKDDAAEAFVTCRLGETPTCIRVPKAPGELVNALPEGNLSIEPRSSGAHGVFSWFDG